MLDSKLIQKYILPVTAMFFVVAYFDKIKSSPGDLMNGNDPPGGSSAVVASLIENSHSQMEYNYSITTNPDNYTAYMVENKVSFVNFQSSSCPF